MSLPRTPENWRGTSVSAPQHLSDHRGPQPRHLALRGHEVLFPLPYCGLTVPLSYSVPQSRHLALRHHTLNMTKKKLKNIQLKSLEALVPTVYKCACIMPHVVCEL